MIGLGADLVADDQTELYREGARLYARAPAALKGLIEARGLGILRARAVPHAEIRLVVDLSQPETERLPPKRTIVFLEVTCDLVLGSQSAHFPAALMCYLRGGRLA